MCFHRNDLIYLRISIVHTHAHAVVMSHNSSSPADQFMIRTIETGLCVSFSVLRSIKFEICSRDKGITQY